MPLFLASLLQPTDDYDVETVSEGFVLRGRPGRDAAFDDVVRRASAHAGASFTAFPIENGKGGYESVLIVPIEC